MDMMSLMITNDGTSYIRDGLFDEDAANDVYRYVGMSYAVESGCSMNSSTPTSCDMVFDIVIAEAYTNDSSNAECGTAISFGGGTCDPDSVAQGVYEAINEMRQQMNLWALYIDTTNGASLLTGCTSFQCTADFNDDGTSESRTYIRQVSNIATASAAMTTAGN